MLSRLRGVHLAVTLKVSLAMYVLNLLIRLACFGTLYEWGIFGF